LPLADICTADILKTFRETYQNTKEEFDKNVMQTRRVIRSKSHWHSRTMTIVADADTGILITGATKPAAPEIPILEDAADNISHMRVGDEFGSVNIADFKKLHESKNIWRRCSPTLSSFSQPMITRFCLSFH
jgi:hypothetical protein